MYAMPLGEKLAFFQIILIDLSLAGDNAIVVGMAVAGLPQALRHRASSLGIGAAALLRACLALFALDILHLTGLTLAGGLLLLLVGWKLYRELRHRHKAQQVQTAGLIAEPLVTKTLGQA
ncbi:MAG: TerC family protein, partial [Alphaproteobacteria bacterium]|nr:TerC family protein [Alphaproteobacteria bacterium]